MYCGSCGKQVADRDRFCIYCGVKRPVMTGGAGSANAQAVNMRMQEAPVSYVPVYHPNPEKVTDNSGAVAAVMIMISVFGCLAAFLGLYSYEIWDIDSASRSFYEIWKRFSAHADKAQMGTIAISLFFFTFGSFGFIDYFVMLLAPKTRNKLVRYIRFNGSCQAMMLLIGMVLNRSYKLNAFGWAFFIIIIVNATLLPYLYNAEKNNKKNRAEEEKEVRYYSTISQADVSRTNQKFGMNCDFCGSAILIGNRCPSCGKMRSPQKNPICNNAGFRWPA